MKIIIYFLLLSFPFISYGQHSWQYDGNGNVIGGSYLDFWPGKSVVLHDFGTRRYFVLDCTHTLLSAYEFNGNLVWATDPWKDNNIMEYRTKRPFIIHISFGHLDPNDWSYSDFQSWNAKSINDYFPTQIRTKTRVLKIVYNNTQFGWINLETGKYFWGGQD